MTAWARSVLASVLAVNVVAFVSSEPAGKTAGYQVGAFTDKTHAQTLLKKLGEKDFYAEVHPKVVGTRSYWVVLVPASDIPFENIQQKLQEAGYPVMPLSEAAWNSIAPAPAKRGTT